MLDSGRAGGRKKQKAAQEKLDLLLSSGNGVNYQDVVRLWRLSMGLTRKDFAAYVGKPEITIKSVEEGIKVPNIKTIEEILARSPYRLRVIQIK